MHVMSCAWSPGHAPAFAGLSLRRPWLVLLSAVIVGGGFFLASHDWRTSLAEAYTQSAEEMELTAEGGNALRRAAFLAMAAWGLYLGVTRPTPLRVRFPLAVSLCLVIGWALVSFLWADDPGLCLRRLLVLACALLAALGLARALCLHELTLLALVVLGTLAALGVVAELHLGTFRPWDSTWRFAGTVHPNTQGPALAAVCLCCWALASQASRGRWVYGLIGLAALALLLATKSRASTAGLVVAAAGIGLVHLSPPKKVALALGGGLAVSWGLWAVWVCGLEPLRDFREALLLGRTEESETLSGRADIWPLVGSYIHQRPWLGYGYEAFWTPERIEAISHELGWGLREAHNTYLEVLLWLGVIGLLWLLAVVVVGLVVAVRGAASGQGHAYLLPFGMLLFSLVNGLLESGMVSVTLVPFLLGCCLMRMAWFAEDDRGLHPGLRSARQAVLHSSPTDARPGPPVAGGVRRDRPAH